MNLTDTTVEAACDTLRKAIKAAENSNDAGERFVVAAAAGMAMMEALTELCDLFARDGECSMERFERLASMFRKDTGYLAPGKDQPMCGPDQPDGDELRSIYDAWYQAKIDRARAALNLAQGKPA